MSRRLVDMSTDHVDIKTRADLLVAVKADRFTCPVCGTSAPSLPEKKRHVRQEHGRKAKAR